MESIYIEGKEFRQIAINHNYYISQYGDVFSKFAKKIIRWNYRGKDGKQYPYVDIWVNGKQRKHTIHRLVYSTWVRELQNNEQVNHKDDNHNNCYYLNLYVGTQKDNIEDCVNNNHRVGNIFYLTLFDKEKNTIISFCPAHKFIEYSGHPNKSGSLNKFFNKNWFKKRYDIIEFKRISNINELKGVTTMGDECNPVGLSLSQSEAHCNPIMD